MIPYDSLPRYPSLTKAVDQALWLSFAHRVEGSSYGAIQSNEGDYLIVPLSHPTFKGETFEKLPKGYGFISYEHIQCIRNDQDPLPHWEAITGAFSVTEDSLFFGRNIHYQSQMIILSTILHLEKVVQNSCVS